MTKLEQAALDLLEGVEAAIKAGDWKVDGACDPDLAVYRLREALAEQNKPQKERQDFIDGYDAGMADAKRIQQAEQEPVACIIHTEEGDYLDWNSKGYCFYTGETPLYAAPVRTKDLTDDDVAKIKGFYAQASFETIVRAAIAADREKNK